MAGITIPQNVAMEEHSTVPILNKSNITVLPPDLKSSRDDFVIQIRGEGLWRWKSLHSKSVMFDALNESLNKLGYSILLTAKERISQCLYKATTTFSKLNSSRLLGKSARDQLKGKIYELRVSASELAVTPEDVIADMEKIHKEMEKKITKLSDDLEEQSEKAFSLMMEQIELKRKNSPTEGLANKGKKIQDVQERQARRKMNEIRYFPPSYVFSLAFQAHSILRSNKEQALHPFLTEENYYGPHCFPPPHTFHLLHKETFFLLGM